MVNSLRLSLIMLVSLLLIAGYSQPAAADNCSSAADCANVVQGTSVLAIILSILLGATASKYSRPSKGKGKDGPIPKKYQKDVDKAIERAKKLKGNKDFIKKFNETVTKLGGSADANTYAEIIDNMTIHSANTSRDPQINKEFNAEQSAHAADPTFEPGNAYSKVGDPGKNVYIRNERMGQGADAIGNTIVHEAAHIAGAPGNPIAEIAIKGIEQASGFK